MLTALKILTSTPELVAITLTELNPHNAASDDTLLQCFAVPSPTRSAGRSRRRSGVRVPSLSLFTRQP
jgi:hypothetical protein